MANPETSLPVSDDPLLALFAALSADRDADRQAEATLVQRYPTDAVTPVIIERRAALWDRLLELASANTVADALGPTALGLVGFGLPGLLHDLTCAPGAQVWPEGRRRHLRFAATLLRMAGARLIDAAAKREMAPWVDTLARVCLRSAATPPGASFDYSWLHLWRDREYSKYHDRPNQPDVHALQGACWTLASEVMDHTLNVGYNASRWLRGQFDRPRQTFLLAEVVGNPYRLSPLQRLALHEPCPEENPAGETCPEETRLEDSSYLWLEAANLRGVLAAILHQRSDGGAMVLPTVPPDILGVLADAAEEAGCTDDRLLAHLRGPGPCGGPHLYSCWALDALATCCQRRGGPAESWPPPLDVPNPTDSRTNPPLTRPIL